MSPFQAPSAAELKQLDILLGNGRYAELEIRAHALLGPYPNSGVVWEKYGISLQMQRKSALKAFQRTAELMPGDAGAQFNLGLVLKSHGQLDAAVASYRRAVKIKPDFAEAYVNLGNALKELGRLDEAMASYRDALKIKRGSADAHNNLGIALKDAGQTEDALASFLEAVKIKPNYADAHFNLGNIYMGLGQLEMAADCYRQALHFKPDFAGAHGNLGTVLKDMGQNEAALEIFRRALDLNPGSAEAHSNLGAALQGLGKLHDAEASYRRALEINPGYARAHNNLGTVLQELGQLDAAVASCRRAVELKPDFAEAHSNLGNLLQGLGQLDAAAASCRRAVELKPDFAEAHSNLGNALQAQGQLDAAVASCRRAVEIKPDFAEAYSNMGHALRELGRLDAAVASCRRAVELKPDFAEAQSNLGIALQDLGQLDDALASFYRALEIDPDFAMAHSNLLFALNHTVHTPQYCLAEARKYGRMVAKKVTSRFFDWRCAPKPERLRVGIVSGDLRIHPVGYFLESFLAQIDPARVELIAYPTNPQVDELTFRIKRHFAAWKPLYGLTDEAAARLIHTDGVHVLLDLAGHTGKNRLPVFAWKPAPIQANWLGYAATTGVAEMDYLLADKMSVPESHRGQYSEIVWHLDALHCLTTPDFDLPVTILPALENGYITFGCFQRLEKIGDEVLLAWSRILIAVPNARLRIACKQLDDPAIAAQFVGRLRRNGIDPARVTLHGAVARKAYLAAHGEVDVILDTFPYPGGTTTCEALWMAVPSITLAGDKLLSRVGASVLNTVNLNEWIATSVDDYVDRAVALVSDLPKLAALRAGLREQAMQSLLFDAERFARNFEEALWSMWLASNRVDSTDATGLPRTSRD